LYGQTTNITAAAKAGIAIALGPDWSPSGSKNLLNELKIARLAAQTAGSNLTDYDLVASATRGAAAILRWDDKIGTLEPGKHADTPAGDDAAYRRARPSTRAGA